MGNEARHHFKLLQVCVSRMIGVIIDCLAMMSINFKHEQAINPSVCAYLHRDNLICKYCGAMKFGLDYSSEKTVEYLWPLILKNNKETIFFQKQ